MEIVVKDNRASELVALSQHVSYALNHEEFLAVCLASSPFDGKLSCGGTVSYSHQFTHLEGSILLASFLLKSPRI